jgi:hypothetical protein
MAKQTARFDDKPDFQHELFGAEADTEAYYGLAQDLNKQYRQPCSGRFVVGVRGRVRSSPAWASARAARNPTGVVQSYAVPTIRGAAALAKRSGDGANGAACDSRDGPRRHTLSAFQHLSFRGRSARRVSAVSYDPERRWPDIPILIAAKAEYAKLQ